LGLALALKLEGAETKARNMLKRIAKLEYNPEFWREYERSYLILAEGYVSREKPDLAQELCRRCLFYNKSSIIALKLMGALEEEKGQTDEATDFYQKCWNLLTKPCPALGFKLSALYLGKKRFIEAIEVATLALPNDSSRKDSDLQKLIIDNCILQLKA
jgi:tetratricopeptide repeat protein 21B